MKINKIKLFLTLLSAVLLCGASLTNSQSLAYHSTVKGFHVGGQITFDLYKPFASIFVNLKRYQKPLALQQGEEIDIYSRLGRKIFVPGYLLFQATGYPLSALSSYLETDHRTQFNKFTIYEDINLLRSFSSGFEEPYAFSLFAGNVLFLAYYDSSQTKRKQSGSALAGFLISTGKHQIYNNIYLHDNWYQFELMLIGNLNEPQKRRASWNFRFGVKLHHNPLLRDMFTFSMERSHTDWSKTCLSLTRNSIFKYKAHFPIPGSKDRTRAAFQLMTFGKKFPANVLDRKLFLVLSLGFRLEWVRNYERDSGQFDEHPARQLIWLIQPNIEF